MGAPYIIYGVSSRVMVLAMMIGCCELTRVTQLAKKTHESPNGENVMHLCGGVGKWVTTPNMGGRICRMRESHYDGGLAMVESEEWKGKMWIE